MNRDESRAALRILQAAFPYPPLRNDTCAVWMDRLGDIDPDAGLEAAGLLAETADRMPSLAELRKTAIGLGKRQRELESTQALVTTADERTATSDEMARDAFAEMRRILQERKAPERR